MEKIEAKLFIADRRINNFMPRINNFNRCARLKQDRKWYVTAQKLSFYPDYPLKDYFLNIIEESDTAYNDTIDGCQTDFWIPAISYDGKIIVHKSVLEIIGANGIIFIAENLPPSKNQ